MAQWLKQSTQYVARIGPFVDATNGVTPETGVTLGAADQAELLKETGATVDISAATFAAITGVGGWYDLTLTTSHTDTLGRLVVIIQDESVCLPVWKEFLVVPANVFESLVKGVEWLETTSLANRVAVSGTTVTIYKQNDADPQYTNTGTFVTGADVLTQLAGKP
jgi:hypothetical protein